MSATSIHATILDKCIHIRREEKVYSSEFCIEFMLGSIESPSKILVLFVTSDGI
uniref:Uncharacterized protein n=1 Tax=Arion vulgaris TaxID=1028688 RepID=A0A0B7A2W4_9EUPU